MHYITYIRVGTPGWRIYSQQGGDGRSQVGVRLVNDWVWMWAEAGVGENLVEVGWSAEVDIEGVLRELCVVGSESVSTNC